MKQFSDNGYQAMQEIDPWNKQIEPYNCST